MQLIENYDSYIAARRRCIRSRYFHVNLFYIIPKKILSPNFVVDIEYWRLSYKSWG